MPSLVTHSPYNNRGWHELFFFMSSIGWEHFPGESSRSSSLCWNFGSVLESYKKDIPNLDPLEEGRVNTLFEGGPVDWDVLLCKENVEEYLGYSCLDFSKVVSPPPRTRRDSCPSLSLGGGSSKRRPSREAEGSLSHSGFKRRRMPSSVPSDIYLVNKKKLDKREKYYFIIIL